jgi:hypothetical protein
MDIESSPVAQEVLMQKHHDETELFVSIDSVHTYCGNCHWLLYLLERLLTEVEDQTLLDLHVALLCYDIAFVVSVFHPLIHDY